MAKILKYGLEWDDWAPPLEIEFAMIRFGGYFENDGVKYGEGLFQHYKNAQSIIWPEEDHHRWSDLILKTILEERLTVIQGSRDSGKTRGVSKFVLVDYFCFPFDTLTLMSSTDVRGLELRVWGDLKDLWDRAVAKFDWLAGNPVDSKHGIFTDALDDENNLRDMRRGIICFVPETKIDTPTGRRRIDEIKVGDRVLNASGIGTVTNVGSRYSPVIVRVTLNDGRFLDCTPEHPFFTNRGWVHALDLRICDVVYSAHETLSILQSTAGGWLSESEVLLQVLPRIWSKEAMRSLREKLSSTKEIQSRHGAHREVLLDSLCEPMGCESSRKYSESFKEVHEVWGTFKASSLQPEILLTGLPRSCGASEVFGVRNPISLPSTFNNSAPDSILQRILQMEITEPEKRINRTRAFCERESLGQDDSRDFVAASNLHGQEVLKACETSLHCGRSHSKAEARYRDGRSDSQSARQDRLRCKKGQRVAGTWVDSVEILRSEGDVRFEQDKGGYRVHNLEVDGHPSYSANGVIVHNCIPVLDSEGNETKSLEKFVGVKQKRRRLVADEAQFLNPRYLNVLSNLDKGEFRAVFTGNPLGQQALDKVAEPECGWDNMPEPSKTTVWRNKFDGVTINLVGTDSPNFDKDKPKTYSYLVDPQDAERVAKRFGPDSIEYYSQIKGVRKAGMNMRLVLTPEMCKVNGAYDPAVCGHGEITNVLGVDAGYGGDACETMFIQFGEDAMGRTVVKFHEPQVIAINLNSEVSPEDQIALGVREKCEGLRIPPKNVAFEAGMRATLAVSFGRIFSGQAEAINAGGSATDRPVSDDLYVDDDEKSVGSKRLKRCNEHYSKFVTELYFSVRALVEAKMAREMPKSVVKEFSEREWIWAKGTKYELESKEDFKKRWGYSPNKADAASIAVEKARRLGLIISRQAEGGKFVPDDNWLEEEVNKHRQFMRKNELTFA